MIYKYNKKLRNYMGCLLFLFFIYLINESLGTSIEKTLYNHIQGITGIIFIFLIAFSEGTIYKYIQREEIELTEESIIIRRKFSNIEKTVKTIKYKDIKKIEPVTYYDDCGIKVYYYISVGESETYKIAGLNKGYKFLSELVDICKRFACRIDKKVLKRREILQKLCNNLNKEKNGRTIIKILFRGLLLSIYVLLIYLEIKYSVPMSKEFIVEEWWRNSLWISWIVGFFMFVFFPIMKYPFDLDED
jgi:hypothetical protein